jgi:hypothetical protein
MRHWVPSKKYDPNDVSALRIAGFGACMITGYPYESGGLFEVACSLVERELSQPVQSTIVSLGGFTAPRAEKHFKRKVFKFNPQYIVIQFGSTDASLPIRATSRSTDAVPKGRTAYRSPSHVTIARWHVQSLLGFVWKTAPIASLLSYVSAIEHMVNDCISAEITPIVLSPFILGSYHSLKNAAKYTNALRDLNSSVNGMIFIDCVRLLSKSHKSQILLNDGLHLSRLGHNLIGEAIGQAIVADMTYHRKSKPELMAI